MQDDPVDRLSASAFTKHWPRFPVSPQVYLDEISTRFRGDGFISENQTFGVARRLERFVERAKKLQAGNRQADAMAILRAVLAQIVLLMERADDSCGCLGDTFQDAFVEYLKKFGPVTGTPDEAFLFDLLNLLIWEDYGLTWRLANGFFKKLDKNRADKCMAYAQKWIEKLRAEDLDYQAEKALTLLGQIVWEQSRFERFEELAREMGAREWERILRLADAAMKRRKRELALHVFECALLQPGLHRDMLIEYYELLKKEGRWEPGMKLAPGAWV